MNEHMPHSSPPLRGGGSSGKTSMNDRPEIAILHQLPQSGGTVIAKCLGSMRGIALLSEVHPAQGAVINREQYDPLFQARNWFPEIDGHVAAEIEAGAPASGQARWLHVVREVERRVATGGRRLLVRDWTHWDFNVKKERETRRLRTRHLLARVFTPRGAVVLRDPGQHFASLSNRPEMSRLSLRRFLESFIDFVHEARYLDLPVLRYEDFCISPDSFLENLCGLLGCPFDPAYHDNWQGFAKLTGNVPFVTGTNRSGRTIVLPPPRPVNRELENLLHGDGMPEFLAEIGYAG
jgi:hypothetical protein